MNSHNEEINQKFKILEIADNFDNKITLYQDIIKLDNTKEKYILEYLKYIQTISKYDEKYQKLFISELKKLHVCISDENYKLYFINVFERKNAINKILDFINMIIKINDLFNSNNLKFKAKFLDDLDILIQKEREIDFHINKKLTWENKELYLYTLYMSLINSMAHIIDFYSNDKTKIESISKLDNYKYYENFLQNETDDAKKEEYSKKLGVIILIEGNYFKKYLKNYNYFLKNLEHNFKAKFDNFELKNKDDQILFENYLQFISNYLFNGNENELIIYWKETFVPLTLEEKEKIFNNFNALNTNSQIKISLLDEGKTLKKIDASNETIQITNIDKYCFYLLTQTFINNINDNDEKYWYLEKYLKPNYYEKNLFVYKNNVWKNLLIDIFKSRTYSDINYSFF